MEDQRAMTHKLTLDNREFIEIHGVTNVEKFTDVDILLDTNLGLLHIKGEKLYMKQLNLDKGLITVEGFVEGLNYTEGAKQKAKGILKKLFR